MGTNDKNVELKYGYNDVNTEGGVERVPGGLCVVANFRNDSASISMGYIPMRGKRSVQAGPSDLAYIPSHVSKPVTDSFALT